MPVSASRLEGERPSFSRRYGAAVLGDVFAAPLSNEALAVVAVGRRALAFRVAAQKAGRTPGFSRLSAQAVTVARSGRRRAPERERWADRSAVLSAGAGYRSTSPVGARLAAQTGQAYRVSAARLCQAVVAAASEAWDPFLVVGRGGTVVPAVKGQLRWAQ